MTALLSYIKILRPHQWLKNLLLLFPPFLRGRWSIRLYDLLLFPHYCPFLLQPVAAT